MTSFLVAGVGYLFGIFFGWLIFQNHGFADGYRQGMIEGNRQAWLRQVAFRKGTGDLYTILSEQEDRNL